MLLTTPVISSLKKSYPDAKIDVLLYQDTIPILSENPEINALYGIKNKKAKASEKIFRARLFLELVEIEVLEQEDAAASGAGIEQVVRRKAGAAVKADVFQTSAPGGKGIGHVRAPSRAKKGAAGQL